MDLLTYLRNFEPYELVKLSGNTYCTREHDSLKISNGKWHWFSRGIGGKSALDYLIKVKEYTLPEAVEAILGRDLETVPSFFMPEKREERVLRLPAFSKSTAEVERYLRNRSIHPEIIRYCIDRKLLFESENYHSAVFVGYDRNYQMRYAAIRGTNSAYKGEASGSDKHYSFSICENPDAERVHLFEAAIDLLSYATLERQAGRDWKSDALLSLAGVFANRRKGVIPVALEQFLKDHPNIKELHLHLDNDEVGRSAAEGILDGLSEKYLIFDEPPLCGKDVNDQLKMLAAREKRKGCYER